MEIKNVWMSWMSWNFVRFHVIFFKKMLKISTFYLEKQKSFIPKKIWAKPRVNWLQYQNNQLCLLTQFSATVLHFKFYKSIFWFWLYGSLSYLSSDLHKIKWIWNKLCVSMMQFQNGVEHVWGSIIIYVKHCFHNTYFSFVKTHPVA